MARAEGADRSEQRRHGCCVSVGQVILGRMHHGDMFGDTLMCFEGVNTLKFVLLLLISPVLLTSALL